MSSIAEIEKAIEGLPASQVDELAGWLQTLRVRRAPASPNRQAWLAKLAQLRQRLATGKTGLTVEQILEEDRGN